MVTKTHTKTINALKELAKHQSVSSLRSVTQLMIIHINEVRDGKCCTEHLEVLEFIKAMHDSIIDFIENR